MAQTQIVRGVQTSVREEDGMTCVRYHSTDVVKFNDKEIILNSGGWRTRTTLLRMNQTMNQFDLGFHVYQSKGLWYVVDRSRLGASVPFADNMVISREGRS